LKVANGQLEGANVKWTVIVVFSFLVMSSLLVSLLTTQSLRSQERSLEAVFAFDYMSIVNVFDDRVFFHVHDLDEPTRRASIYLVRFLKCGIKSGGADFLTCCQMRKTEVWFHRPASIVFGRGSKMTSKTMVC
jgi:hypothetical protein